MNYVQERENKREFQSQDFVLWHYRSGNHVVPVPCVVVRQDAETVIIRARIEGKAQEFAVSPDELVER